MSNIMNIPVSSITTQPSIELARTVRTTLRKLGLFHAYERNDKFYTIDLPFQLITNRAGNNLAVVIEKNRMPRRYPYAKIIGSKSFIEEQIGIPVNIHETSDSIAICLETSGRNLLNIGMSMTG